MAPALLSKLVTLQNNRINEIRMIGNRMRDRDMGTLNKSIVQTRITTINEIWADARKAHDDITTRSDAEADPYVAENKFQSMREEYEDALDLLLNTLAGLSGADEQRLEPENRRRARDDDDGEVRPAKLPRLDLPTFSGQYEDWDSFADVFTTLVHNARRIPDVTKLHYLKSCLSDAAAELVKDVPMLGINYASTWNALQNRFHIPRLTANKLLDALLDLPYMKRECAGELRDFIDRAQRIVRTLANLKAPVSQWDMWLVHILEVRLDPDSRKAWETEVSVKESCAAAEARTLDPAAPPRFPTFAELALFDEKRANALAMIREEKAVKTASCASKTGTKRVHHAQSGKPAKAAKCFGCGQSHYLSKCPAYLAKNPHERMNQVRHFRLCFNCLGKHKFKDCQSKGRCNTCREQHHSTLHYDRTANRTNESVPIDRKPDSKTDAKTQVASAVSEPAIRVNACRKIATSKRGAILLATAQVIVIGPHGNQTRARVLLDQGSEATFISESLTQMLGLERERVKTKLTGIGESSAGSARSITSFAIQSCRDPSFKLVLDAYVLPRLTSQLPSKSLTDLDFSFLEKLPLADPRFHVSEAVDILIGADFYGQILRAGFQKFPSTLLVAQDTALGWIISGPTQAGASRRAESSYKTSVTVLRCAVNDDLSQELQKFWNLEEVPSSDRKLKPADEACEKLFVDTHVRDADGHFRVRLPLKSEPPNVAAETRSVALSSLQLVHRRFMRDPSLARAYNDFMTTYIELGHMVPVPPEELNSQRAWYVPHHAVVQGAKIRVVFNASQRTSNQRCLNDFLMTGPPLQSDLPLILLNWRRYRYAFTADIVKMFRQIRIAREDQDLPRILWSPSADEQPVDYRLTTVTYGTACAPYLAIRTLLQLAEDQKEKYPLGSKCLTANTYVDDTFAGADELSTALRKRDELVELLKSAGIELNKWAANHPEIVPSHVNSNANVTIVELDRDSAVKTLGVHWDPSLDKFSFTASNPASQEKATKRSVFSDIARLFDPLGWLAPITVSAKIMMQDLWILKFDWDAPLTGDVRRRWFDYCQSLAALPTLSIDRWLGLLRDKSFQIHGFSDASSRAYAAVIYLRIAESDGKYRVALLCAKTKVAPVKTMSVPNLELCGAVLLVKLVRFVQKLEFLNGVPIRLWSDSQIVLRWLEKHPCTWQTFVANRVSLIQTELPSATWSHVPTKQNPADLATRGATPAELRDIDLWWRGPTWLACDSDKWPRSPTPVKTLHVKSNENEPELLTRFSNLSRLIRVAAYCLRPLLQLRRRKEKQGPLPKALTTAELTSARHVLIRLAQAHAFPNEISLLRADKPLSKHNPLRTLNPMVTSDGILRVGGRITNANLANDLKHPPILPKNSALSRLFVRYAHVSALHGGPTLTASVLMRLAWITGMRRLIKDVFRSCMICQRQKPRLASQLMGDLPIERVTPARSFTVSGLDYAGPIQVRTSKGRGQRAYKGYIALFVCFATKAIHLEAVSDLTTATFIAALRRFFSRRGLAKKIFSDNATTFHGADTELRRMFNAASEFYQDASATLANNGTAWTFIPPTTPHYGGLWEAGVKSTKHLLKRAIGEHTLTFEELSTVLAEVEACLNSRPLSPFTADPEDLRVLTPAHFLIGTASGLIPDEAIPPVAENRLSRFQLLQRIPDHFWKRWSAEYLTTLQERRKWTEPTANFPVGQLVLIRDDRYPPAKWPLGRIIEVHPGPDGKVRVATVKTATNTLRRHIACLAPLIMEQPNARKDAPPCVQ